MDLSRKLGILVVHGVPVIVGGGIAYALFDSWAAVFVWETILLLNAVGLVSK